jgi:hypothetical protein
MGGEPADEPIEREGEPPWVHAVIDHEHRYSLSTEAATGRHQLQVEISAGIVDFEVVEDLDPATFTALSADPRAARERAAHLRARRGRRA